MIRVNRKTPTAPTDATAIKVIITIIQPLPWVVPIRVWDRKLPCYLEEWQINLLDSRNVWVP